MVNIYIREIFVTNSQTDQMPNGNLVSDVSGPLDKNDPNSHRLSQGEKISFTDINIIFVDDTGNNLLAPTDFNEDTFKGKLWIAWNYVDDVDSGNNEPRWTSAKFVVEISD